MSGGVDSSVAAALLHEAGHHVVGISMRLYDASRESEHGQCCSPEDFEDARRIAQILGFPYYVLNLTERFAREVVRNFVSEYMAGRTPNPCVHCNDSLKFETLRQKAVELECDAMATGHYARITETDGRFSLRKGLDPTKDQSYFLFTLTQPQMGQVLFPLGGLTKAAVRQKADELGLPVAEKSESNEICFVPGDDYVSFLENREAFVVRPGKIINRRGDVLGDHPGVHRFTIGQRKGLGVPYSEPLYVLEIRPEEGVVVVGVRDELAARGLYASRMNWLDGFPPEPGTEAHVKIRYRHRGVPARLHPDSGGGCEIRFFTPVEAVAPGQAAVACVGDRIIGGGWIERALS